MTAALNEVEALISRMSAGEKAQVLKWIARDFDGICPGVERNLSVAGGAPCIVRTRIPVWVLVKAMKLGASEADLLKVYPSLRAEDLVNAWGFYHMHSSEIEDEIAENEAS